MIDQLVLSGWWIWLLAAWVGLLFILNVFRILTPNAREKRILAGKQKLHDTWTRVSGIFGVLLFGTFALYILEIIK